MFLYRKRRVLFTKRAGFCVILVLCCLSLVWVGNFIRRYKTASASALRPLPPASQVSKTPSKITSSGIFKSQTAKNVHPDNTLLNSSVATRRPVDNLRSKFERKSSSQSAWSVDDKVSKLNIADDEKPTSQMVKNVLPVNTVEKSNVVISRSLITQNSKSETISSSLLEPQSKKKEAFTSATISDGKFSNQTTKNVHHSGNTTLKSSTTIIRRSTQILNTKFEHEPFSQLKPQSYEEKVINSRAHEVPQNQRIANILLPQTSSNGSFIVQRSIDVLNLIHQNAARTRTATRTAKIPVYKSNDIHKLPPLLETLRLVSFERNIRPSTKEVECSNDKPPPEQLADEPLRWQPVSQSTSTTKAYVFSAYYDRRWNPAIVTIIGLASDYNVSHDGEHQRFCRMWFSGKETPLTVAADFRIVPDAHNKEFAAGLYTCSTSSAPYAVSLVSTCSEAASNLLKVVDTGLLGEARSVNRTADSKHYTVCIALLHSNYCNFRRLVETVEFNRMFGAQRVTLYHLSSCPDVRLILDSYQRDGVVEIIPWDSLPLISRYNKVHYFAQLAAVNDCLYRNLPRSTFALFSDIDEVAVPRKNAGGDSWNNVLEKATQDWLTNEKLSKNSFPGVYIIRNAFFPASQRANSDLGNLTEWSKEDNYLGANHEFRENYIFRHRIRSKYFVWTKAVVMAGIHFAHEMLNGAVKMVHVSDQVSLLHHFRRFSSKPIIKDNWMDRYGCYIKERIHDRRDAIFRGHPTPVGRQVSFSNETNHSCEIPEKNF